MHISARANSGSQAQNRRKSENWPCQLTVQAARNTRRILIGFFLILFRVLFTCFSLSLSLCKNAWTRTSNTFIWKSCCFSFFFCFCFLFGFFYCCIASWRDLAAAIKVQNSIRLDPKKVWEGDEEEGREKETERETDERDNLTNKLNTQKATTRCKKLMLNSKECHKGYIV